MGKEKQEIILGKDDEPKMKATLEGDGTATVELAIGSAVPWSQNQSNSIYFTDTPLMTTAIIPNDFHDIVPILRWYYANDAMFGTVIDTMVELAMDNVIKNNTEDKKVQEFFDGIVETSNIKKACRWAMLEYILINNVFPYRVKHKNSVITRAGKSVPLYEWTILNPEYTHVEGSLLFGDPLIVLKPNNDLKGLLKAEQDGVMPKLLPARLSKDILESGILPLDSSSVYHIARHKQPFQRYAPVSLRRVLRPLKMKEIYMKMDVSTANSVINQVIVFKLGSDEFPVKDSSTLREFHRLISTNSKAYQLVWTHALEIDYVRADAEALDPKKYEFINQELLYGFSIPPLMMGQGAEKGSSNAYLAVKGMVERLTWAREDIEEWLEREFRLIAEENKLKSWPKPILGNPNLEEERTFRQILLNLHQHGVLSGETLLEETGFDILTEIERLKIEKDIREKEGILIPSSPFQKSKNDSDSTGVAPVSSEGRPEGTVEDKKRDKRDINPSPSGSSVASMITTAAISQEEEEYLEKTKEIYLIKLLALYKLLQKKIMEEAKKDEIDEDLIKSLILEFCSEMSKLGEEVFKQISEWSYMSIYYEIIKDGSYNSFIDKVKLWNDAYIKKLGKDIESQILELDNEEDDYLTFVNLVLEKERYRLKMFANEGVKKARLAGVTSGHLDHGYKSVRWECQFRNSCELCIERHGEVYPIEDVFELYPAHVNCECELEFINSFYSSSDGR